LQGKECSRKGPTIRIRVNLQGMDLSRKSRNGISKEQYLQGKEFARNGLCKECGLCCAYVRNFCSQTFRLYLGSIKSITAFSLSSLCSSIFRPAHRLYSVFVAGQEHHVTKFSSFSSPNCSVSIHCCSSCTSHRCRQRGRSLQSALS